MGLIQEAVSPASLREGPRQPSHISDLKRRLDVSFHFQHLAILNLKGFEGLPLIVLQLQRMGVILFQGFNQCIKGITYSTDLTTVTSHFVEDLFLSLRRSAVTDVDVDQREKHLADWIDPLRYVTGPWGSESNNPHH
jgi:hypothetical protein